MRFQPPPFVPAGRDLFEARPAGAMDWPALQARLQARLGEDAVYQWAPHADPRPEHAQRRVRSLRGRHLLPPPLPRPTWLLERPIPLRGPARKLASPYASCEARLRSS